MTVSSSLPCVTIDRKIISKFTYSVLIFISFREIYLHHFADIEWYIRMSSIKKFTSDLFHKFFFINIFRIIIRASIPSFTVIDWHIRLSFSLNGGFRFCTARRVFREKSFRASRTFRGTSPLLLYVRTRTLPLPFCAAA